MHVTKITRVAAGHILAHNEPTKARSERSNVDSSRTKDNYNLLHSPCKNGMENLKYILSKSNVYCSPRKDVNVVCSWVVTAPSELPRDREREFFLRAAQFFSERYKPSVCVSAWVHKDEKTPHLHFDFIPLVADKKRSGYKVCAKEVVTRQDLKTAHDDFQSYIKRTMQLDLEIRNGATENGNKSILQLQNKTLKDENRKLEQLKRTVQDELSRELCR